MENYYNNFDKFISGTAATPLILMFIVFFTMLLAVLIIGIAKYIIEAFALYSIGKKLGRKYSFLAFIPFQSIYFRTFVLSDIAGQKPFVLTEKIKTNSRIKSFIIYLLSGIIGGTIISLSSGLLSLASSIISSFTSFLSGSSIDSTLGMMLSGTTSILFSALGMLVTSVLSLTLNIVLKSIEFVYLKDVFDIYFNDEKDNKKKALIITLLDFFVTLGFARAIYLFILNKKYEPDITLWETAQNTESHPLYTQQHDEQQDYTDYYTNE